MLGSSDAHAYLPAPVRENWAEALSISIKVTKVLITGVSECSGEGSGEGSGEHGDESSAGSGSGSGSGSGASIGAGRTVAATRRARRPAAVAHVRICIDLSFDFDDVGRAVPGPIQLAIAESRRS